MRKGKNVWVNCEGQQIKSAVRPGEPEDDWFPDWPEYRVQGCKYQPYHGGTEWEEAANSSMAASANDNFRGGRY